MRPDRRGFTRLEIDAELLARLAGLGHSPGMCRRCALSPTPVMTVDQAAECHGLERRIIDGGE